MSAGIVWLRRDLRLADHPALTAACRTQERVLPVYVHSPREEAPWAAGAAGRWWLHHSLQALEESLAKRGGQLHLAAGETLPVLCRLIEQTGAGAIHWTRCYEPAAMARDARIESTLRARGVAVQIHAGNLWFEPGQISGAERQPYRVFTPFWRRAAARLPTPAPLAQARPRAWLRLPGSLPLAALGLEPRHPWTLGLARTWRPGEKGARQALARFGEGGAADYARRRDRPACAGTSRLSPHLHFGEITPCQILHALRRRLDPAECGAQADLEAYLRQLGWREFAYHLLHHFPGIGERNFDRRFDAFPWIEPDEARFDRWRRGRTGVPLVDAGMRELWSTGWMHNRVRMIVASFLSKNLRLHWLHGARWFWDTLVDADLANNTLGWQWVAGCGPDAAPYFRVFNPYTQAARFDPEARYLRRWLPELAALPAVLLLEPWRDPAALRRCGYPPPMLDLGASRRAALAAFGALAPNRAAGGSPG